ncbi:hypothetical protein AGMMS49938_14570 [Fibrobacterales bacterium]|nr:hypothetical protein AGMMS49938_14570 [Fibrobacterales bacterium]
MTTEIEILRQEIDKIEDRLIYLLNKRAKLAFEIGKIKKKRGLPIKDAERENLILNRVAKKNKPNSRGIRGTVSDDFMRNIFKKIIDEAVRIEHDAVSRELGA